MQTECRNFMETVRVRLAKIRFPLGSAGVCAQHPGCAESMFPREALRRAPIF